MSKLVPNSITMHWIGNVSSSGDSQSANNKIDTLPIKENRQIYFCEKKGASLGQKLNTHISSIIYFLFISSNIKWNYSSTTGEIYQYLDYSTKLLSCHLLSQSNYLDVQLCTLRQFTLQNYVITDYTCL